MGCGIAGIETELLTRSRLCLDWRQRLLANRTNMLTVVEDHFGDGASLMPQCTDHPVRPRPGRDDDREVGND